LAESPVCTAQSASASDHGLERGVQLRRVVDSTLNLPYTDVWLTISKIVNRMKWRIRNQVGDRVRWYAEPEEEPAGV
jgi:hypothetical protein